jgi:hypothetical protein
MRVWVEKNIGRREKREHREEISRYGIRSKGGWKKFYDFGIFFVRPLRI